MQLDYEPFRGNSFPQLSNRFFAYPAIVGLLQLRGALALDELRVCQCLQVPKYTFAQGRNPCHTPSTHGAKTGWRTENAWKTGDSVNSGFRARIADSRRSVASICDSVGGRCIGSV